MGVEDRCLSGVARLRYGESSCGVIKSEDDVGDSVAALCAGVEGGEQGVGVEGGVLQQRSAFDEDDDEGFAGLFHLGDEFFLSA